MSSHASMVLRYLSDLTIVAQSNHIYQYLNTIKKGVTERGYHLNQLAEHCGFKMNVANKSFKRKTESDDIGTIFVKYLVSTMHLDFNVTVEEHPYFIFNGVPVEDITGLYDTHLNKSDVGVMVTTCNGLTNLVEIEINSSQMVHTVIKTLHGLLQLARIAKPFKVPHDKIR